MWTKWSLALSNGFTHEHQFIALGAEQTRMIDTFDYTSPLGALGKAEAQTK